MGRARFLRSHFVAWALLILSVVVAALAFATFVAHRQAALRLVLERDQQVIQLSAVRLREELTKFSTALEAVARTEAFSSRDSLIRSLALRQAAPVREGLFDGGVVLLDNFGRVIAAEPAELNVLGQDWSDRDPFRHLLSTSAPVFSSAIDQGPGGAQVVAVSVPVLGADGRFTGALVGMLRLGVSTISPFYASIVRLRIGGHGATYVLDGHRTILYDSAGDRVGQLYDAEILPRETNVHLAGATRREGPGGREYIVAYAPIPGTPWTLITEEDWYSLTSSTQHYVDLLLVLLGLGALLPAAGVALLMRHHDTRHATRTGAEQETRLAGRLRQWLNHYQLPVLPGWTLAAHLQPAEAARTALYDVMLLPDGRLLLTLCETVGDRMGECVPTCMALVSTRITLRGAARMLLSPAQALSRSNEVLCPEMPDTTAMLCLYAVLDPATGNLCMANAGLPTPYYRDREGVHELNLPGRPLASCPTAVYEEREVTLVAGDRVLFYSSGLPEAENLQGENFGSERLQQIVCGHHDASEMVSAIATTLKEFSDGGRRPPRDVAVVVLERNAPFEGPEEPDPF